MIDEGEADWKILTIDVNDPLANELNDIADVDKILPGLLNATRDWFKFYKVPTGKPINNFAEDGKFFDKAFALGVINHDHGSWKKLVNGDYPKAGIQLENTLFGSLSARVTPTEASKIMEDTAEEFNPEPASMDTMELDKTHYINRDNY